MKNLLILAICLSSFTSCKKESVYSSSKSEVVNQTLKVNQGFNLDLGGFGDEEGASISLQAKNYSKSELERVNFASIIYHYTPSKDFIGNDKVEILLNKGSNGTPYSGTKTTKVINFTITK